MRLVADNKEDYKALALIQKLITQQFKQEKDTGSALEGATKMFINTSIEKSYEKPGDSVKAINNTSTMETDDPALFVAYIVHAALNRKQMGIEYRDAKGKVSKRLIEPFSWRNNQVVAWCHERGAWRQFAPKQMVRIAVTELPFERSEDVEMVASNATEMAHVIAI